MKVWLQQIKRYLWDNNYINLWMRIKAMELYIRMTDYDTLVFIFFWCDLAQQLAFVHTWVQEWKLQISDIGRSIILLYNQLKEDYPLLGEHQMLEELPRANSYGNYIMQQFWKKDFFNSIFQTFQVLSCRNAGMGIRTSSARRNSKWNSITNWGNQYHFSI